MNKSYFIETESALNNITNLFNDVWPLAVGLWNLRCSVNGIIHEYPAITEPELAAKFSKGSAIHGVNYKQAFVDKTWEEQQGTLAWIILNDAFAIYEGWLARICENYFSKEKDFIKSFQFPVDKKYKMNVKAVLTKICVSANSEISNSFYASYSNPNKPKIDFNHINEYLYCYRAFKEARNCYMHFGGIANDKLIFAYKDYVTYCSRSTLDVKELPEFIMPIRGSSIVLSLRGVVGFSQILIKLLLTLDAELIKTESANEEYLRRFREKHGSKTILKQIDVDANKQIERYSMQCGFHKPINTDQLRLWLKMKGIVY